MYLEVLPQEAQDILSEYDIQYDHVFETITSTTFFYNVNGCDELLIIDNYSIRFNHFKVELPTDRNDDYWILATKMIKMVIDDYIETWIENLKGAYI